MLRSHFAVLLFHPVEALQNKGPLYEIVLVVSCCSVRYMWVYLAFWTYHIYSRICPQLLAEILTTKLWGSAYTRVMPHSHTYTVRVSTA